jgi:glycosyltransferase involved in cell wall biosynthesis
VKISVYITSFNQKEYLKQAVLSVVNQTIAPFEILIVDDCSSDGSQELIKEYSLTHSNVRYIFHEQNRGVAQVRITALENIKGDYVTYLDGDDLYLPNKLEVESNIILSEGCDLAFSNNMYVNPDDLSDVKWIWAYDNIDLSNKVDLFVKTITRDFPRDSLFRMELVDYELLKKVGFHDPMLKIYEDYDLRIRLAQHAKMNYTLEPTSKIRISKSGLSKLDTIEHYKAFKYIFDKYASDIALLETKTQNKVNSRLSELLLERKPKGTQASGSLLKKIKKRFKQ